MSEKNEERGRETPPPYVGVPEKDEYLSTRELLLEMGKILLLAVVIIIPIRVFFFQPFFVQGSSMEPNFEDGEYLVISELGYKYTDLSLFGDLKIAPWKEIVRQEPVVFRYPRNPDQFFIKRAIGLPGETIEIKDNKISITNKDYPNSFILNESAYLDPDVKTTDMPKLTLSDDEYLVLGDNRPFSYDSRSFGPIKKEAVIGQVLLRAWPLSRLDLY